MVTPQPLSRAEAYALLRKLSELETDMAAYREERAHLMSRVAALETEIIALHDAIGLMHASLSWRVSYPVRLLGSLARKLLNPRPLFRWPLMMLRLRSRNNPSAISSQSCPLPSPAVSKAALASQPASSIDAENALVTLDVLYLLSRSL